MYDMWVEWQPTKQAWRLDHDATKKVYLDDNGQVVFNCEIHEVRFYPCCPKAAPINETIEHGEQYNIFYYLDL